MSRSGYYDDIDDPLVIGRWRAQVASSTRGKRGELEAALTPFVEAFEQFAKNEACSRVLSLGQLGRLAAGEVSGAHFKTACQVLTRQD